MVLTTYLVLCFPISILWRVRVTIRKKLLLTGVFCLTVFTIIVTIIRGTIQNGKSGLDFSKSQNVGWVWFWIVIEFMTGKPTILHIPLPISRLLTKPNSLHSLYHGLCCFLQNAIRPQ